MSDSKIEEIGDEPKEEPKESDVSVMAELVLDQPEAAFASLEFQKLDPRAILVEQIGGWIFLAILIVADLVAFTILAIGMSPIGILYFSLLGGSVLLLGFIGWALQAYPALAHRHYQWRYGEKGLEIQKGVWFRREITVPRVRVQHTDVHQGPLMRKFDLAKLIVHTAGTQDATVEIDGLHIATARSLRDMLIADRGLPNDS